MRLVTKVGDGRPLTICLGRATENEVTELAFDLTPWITEFGSSGTAAILLTRPTETASAPVLTSMDGNIAYHVLTDGDLQYTGDGEVQIVYTVGTKRKKSATYNTRILRSLSTDGTAPGPWQGWVDNVTTAAATTATNAAAAAASATSASTSSTAALASKDAAAISETNAASSATSAANSSSSASTSATNAANSASAASTSATNASNSASVAETSATNASNSASAASASATAAETSATNASNSASAAETSATNASNSASAAGTSATNASTSATNASNSASVAETSATNASNSASAASTSANSAANSATAAETSATNAAGSAASAATSAETAATNAATAVTSSSAAYTSATNAESYANSASSSASEANASKNLSATSAANAATSETNAANSATLSGTSATNAANSATSAATSETNAASSATSASASATNAANSASQASAAVEHYPYINSSTNTWYVWNVSTSAWVNTGVSATGTFTEVEAEIDDQTGTPSVNVEYESGSVKFSFHNIKGATNFNDLSNRPSYNNSAITGSTNIPEVKTATWDAKQEALVSSENIKTIGGVSILGSGNLSTATNYIFNIGTTWTGTEAPYSQTITVNGILADDIPFVDLVPSSTYSTATTELSNWSKIYKMTVTAANTITVYAKEATTVALTVQARCVR